MNPNIVTKFLGKYSPQTHAIGAALVFLIGAYAEVPQFHAYVNTLASHLPNIITGGIGAGVAVYLHYRSGAAKA